MSLRLAGALYLAIIVCGVGSEAALRGPLITAGDADATAAALLSADRLFRLSMIADVVMALCDVALASLLFRWLYSVDRTLSLMAMTFRLVQAAILASNLSSLHSALSVLTQPGLDAEASRAMAMVHLQAHAAGYDLGLFFFGVNCVLTGSLLVRSDLVPRALGVLMWGAGCVYLWGSTLRIVAPDVVEAFAPAYTVPLMAELWFCGWLLLRAPGAPRPLERAPIDQARSTHAWA